MAADAIILAGGLGTRLRPVTGGLLPKVLVPVLGRPFIDYKLRSLAVLGVERVLLSIGEGADQVVAHVGDGSRFGVQVDFIEDGPRLLGTGGAIKRALPRLPATFWVTYGDTLVVADLADIERRIDELPDVTGAMTVLENVDEWETSNVSVLDGRVAAYEKGVPPGSHRFLDYGLLCFAASAFDVVADDTVADLRSVIEPMVAARTMLAARVDERFWDVGTPERLRETEAHFEATAMWERLA
jgi:MurNAc alpha-1-phosphate uridylyltransferase